MIETESTESRVQAASSDHPPKGSTQVLTIKASRGWASLDLRNLWAARELLAFFVWRDLKVRYKQTALGASWAVIQPFMTMVVFTIFFGRLAKVPSDGLPYPIFAFSALVPWTFFSTSLSHASGSLVASQNLVSKVYFPRMILPMASVIGGLVDLVIASVVLGGMMAFYGTAPTINALFIPLLIVMVIVTALGVGLIMSALSVQFRDVRYTVPFMIQFWLFATPIAYPTTLLPEAWRVVYGLNPMVGVVDGFRWALLGAPAPGVAIIPSIAVALTLLVVGAVYFRRMERTFADVI